MRCQEIKSWTFKGLVAAFVDLYVAFSLLCASTLVYLSSKFLSLFGLTLPCPCDGLFSDSHKSKCFQETLGDLPVKKISSVQRSVRNTTPFDSLLYKEANGECVGKKRKGERRHVELEEGVSSSPSVELVQNASGFDLLTSQSCKKGSFRVKSKRFSFQPSPFGIKNHCQGKLRNKRSPLSPASVMDVDQNDPLLMNSKEGMEDIALRKSVSVNSVGCETGALKKQWERTYSCNSPVDLTQKTIESVEQMLVEERAARAALALELEKERNAAATAADEALSMILRYQEEKASIEMEARQYQRMIEEKTAFDAEEMSILKEILLRREMEKHFLEKEVESYRKMFVDNEQPLPNTPDSKPPQHMIEPLDAAADYENDDSYKPREIDSSEEMNAYVVDQNSEEREPEPVSRFSNISESHQTDCHVHDIHVDNKVQLNVPFDQATLDLKLDRSKSVSDTSFGQRNISPNMRRNSMSALDCERLKIESEVGLLRGRLRAVQQGREKIRFSSKEHSRSLMQRLGDKTSRFWQTRRSGPLHSSTPSSSMVKTMSMTLDLHSA